MGTSPGNMSNLPNSSSFGLPTSFSMSSFGAPHAVLWVLLAIVGLLIVMHTLKGGRRR